MAEADEESSHVWSHKARIALFLSAMRHFRDRLLRKGYRVDYRALDEDAEALSLADALEDSVRRLKSERLVMVRAGEWRVADALERAAGRLSVPLERREDGHFLSSPEDFDRHAESRKELVMEFFYREMRRRHGILMDDGQPAGGVWNLDKENRAAFGKEGPPQPLPERPSFRPDRVTREVIRLVNRRFSDHPGSLDRFHWPVTPRQASSALDAFVSSLLPGFGPWEDAMWSGEPFLYHSCLSSSLNLKLLNPRRVLASAERAYREGQAPLNSVEGFVRQILGWREYVRGVYWRYMPGYLERNALDAALPLPGFYWTGETDMQCLRRCIGQTLDFAYAHHIQRLMVTGLFALLFGVNPVEVHRWYLAVYVDAVEWVELPNTLGMSQFADGGLLGTKPYAATGKYIQRMSNYCGSCRFRPAERTGETACPYTTLYWDFLLRHRKRFADNPRMALQVRNLERLATAETRAIRARADTLRSGA